MSVQVETRTVTPPYEEAKINDRGIKSQGAETWSVPPSKWTPMIHPIAEETAREVDGYFLDNWNFPNDRSKKVFLKAGFSRVTCLYFPLAKDDRIHFACRLLTVLFLVDGLLHILVC
jgi:aristolochene synthase